jgi:Cu(I)/Ag(I) efflux system membrane fusion protein
MKLCIKIRGLILLLAAVLASAGLWVTGCNRNESAQGDQLYTCGMHPQVIRNKPGNCPICGMKLTPIRKQDAAGNSSNGSLPNSTKSNMSISNAEEAGIITIDPTTTQNMGLRTGVVTRGPVRRNVRTVGIIDYDETALAEVSTKFRGWIEKLYVDATGKQMHRGEPLFEIYSPELYLAQTEYLLSLGSMTNHESTAAELRKTASLTKLKYWDISDDQIAEVERTRTAKKTLRVNAPRDGIVVEKMVVEGQMVEAGARLYRLADLATVWVQAQVYEQDLPFIKLGQEAVVSLASQPDPKFRGRVTYLYPMVDDKTRTAKVRMEFHNPGYFLKPGMYATVELSAELAPSALLVPDIAVLRSGEKNTVFVALDGGRFEPRTVILGPRTGEDAYAVLSGLNEGERVVTSGQFMLDSESQLREAIQKMMKPGETGASMTSTMSGHRMNNAMPATPEHVVYICPMPEHVALQYEHPGKCPLCGMTLVPVTPETLAKIQPGGHIEYYTCPMPEHSDVRSDKPGKCPKCNMTLIPVMKQEPSPATNMAPNMSSMLPEKLYTCPMESHADIVSDKPGKCPKCGMDLVETSKVKHGKIAEQHWVEQHQEHPH